MKIVPVIMAGGAGTRLWPLSRNDKPKQFHNLSGKGTLMEHTIKRMMPLKPETYIIVTSYKYEDMSLNELKSTGVNGVTLCEPEPKNTAAAVLYAAVYLDKFNEDSTMIVLPADHYIKNTENFTEVLRSAVMEAENGNLVTIGIKPAYPETGYGYIKALEGMSGNILPVESFVEKPDLVKAREYYESGNYFWNSGIFIWKTSVILDAFREHMPDHIKAFNPLMDLSMDAFLSGKPSNWDFKKRIFASLESISIDYGIMEKSERRVVIPADFGWADLGSWNSIDDILTPDDKSNRSPVSDRAIFINSENCSVFSEKSRIAVVGLSNVVVVQAGNEILVIDKDSSQDVRKVVESINKRGKE